jgi:predicted nucleic acid-binding protein
VKFWDSSALVPLFAEEPTSRQCRDLYRADPVVVVWQFTETEIVSALKKRSRDDPAFGQQGGLDTALARLDQLAARWEVYEALGLHVLALVRKRARELLLRHTLKTGDALQLSAAVLRFDPPMKRDFVVFDGALARAAAKEGFNVIRLKAKRPRRGR